METEIFYMPDGRKAEKRVTVDGTNRITEIWAEEAPPLKLVEKITEKIAAPEPMVVERIIEKVDEHGTVLERKVEKVEGDHPVSAEKQVGYVTKEEMVDAIAQAIVDAEKPKADKPAWWKGHAVAKSDKPVAPKKLPMTAQMTIQERMAGMGDNPQLVNYIIWGVLIVGAGVALYFSL